MKKKTVRLKAALVAITAITATSLERGAVAAGADARKSILDTYEAAAKAESTSFAGFDARRGEAFFLGRHAGGKPDTPSCTSCHTTNLKGPGKSSAGKAIEPMAASVNAKRYTDAADVAKWFKRNCNDVLGRECTAQEKGDVLIYLLGL